jgi:hypothetical protein
MKKEIRKEKRKKEGREERNTIESEHQRVSTTSIILVYTRKRNVYISNWNSSVRQSNEASIFWRSWPTRSCCTMDKIYMLKNCTFFPVH